MLQACPIGGAVTDLRPSRVAALVLVVTAAGRKGIDAGPVRALLGLIPAESGVAVALARGEGIRDIALATGRSHTTIRWHIKHIFAKLGASRQVELALSAADIPQARRGRLRRRTRADGAVRVQAILRNLPSDPIHPEGGNAALGFLGFGSIRGSRVNHSPPGKGSLLTRERHSILSSASRASFTVRLFPFAFQYSKRIFVSSFPRRPKPSAVR